MITAPTIRSKHATAPPTPPAMALTLLELSFAELAFAGAFANTSMHVGTGHDCDDGGELSAHSVDTTGSKLGLAMQLTARVIEPSCWGYDEHVSEQAPHSPSWYEYVTHVGSWLQGCCVTGAGPGHAVPAGSNEPADDRQAAERIRVGGGPPETAHVAEQAPHSPNWYE